jgi:YVTN family beta-propeller protein
MARLRYVFFFLLLALTGSCVQPELQTRPALVNEGEVFLYLQPVPEAFQRLEFTIEGITASREDADEVPLNLMFAEVNGAELIGRQKFLASAVLPPGSYNGLSIRIKSASLRGEGGESALLLPEEPLRVAHSFKVIRRKATALFLALDPSGGFTRGVSFTPSFSIETLRPPVLDLIGYVSCAESNIVTVFNKKTMRVVDVIATGSGPKGMLFDRRRRRAYVALSGENAVIVIDMIAGEITNRASLRYGDGPTELAITPDGRTLVVVNTAANTVSIVDAVSLTETDRIQVGNRPTSAAINPVASRAFITDALSNTVSVVDLNRNVLLTALAAGVTPLRARFDPTGGSLFVINRDAPDITVISPASLTTGDNIFAGMGAVSIAVDDLTGLVYVGKRFGNEIAVIAPRLLMFIDRIAVQGNAAYLETDEQENSLLVVLPDRNVLQKINITSKRVVSEIEVGEGAYAVVVMGTR